MSLQPSESGSPPIAGGEVRDRIMEAVTQLIAEHGIDGMTMRQIADQTGLSTGTINYHFNNKRGLVIAALERAYRVPGEWEELKGPASEKLRVLTRGFVLTTPRLHNWWRFWSDYTAHSTRDAEFRKHQLERVERQSVFFARVIEEGIAAGEFSREISARAAGDTLVTLAYGVALRQILEPGASQTRQARRTLDIAIERLALPNAAHLD